jgi:hypothetical protein
VRHTLILAGLTTLVLNLASFVTDTTPLRPDTSRAALIRLGEEYGDLQQWAEAIAEASDTLGAADIEQARMLALHLVRVIGPLEENFENTTAAFSTRQIEQILPLWERMVFAHAGFLLIQEQAASLGTDPVMDPAELHEVALQLLAVLEFALEIQHQILDELTAPIATPIRVL